MKLILKIVSALFLLFLLAFAGLSIAVSYNSPCEPTSGSPIASNQMKAIVYRCYGSPDVLKLETMAIPTPADNEVLIKVRAAAVNPLDWHYMRGSPALMRLMSGIGKPSDNRLGVDFAGTVEAVGKNVAHFEPGDAVFGGKNGSFAEYIVMDADRALARKPDSASFEQAAAMPIAAISALQALRDKGKLQAGQSVLINGASGGVGTYAVQIAKALGAEVTGVCSGRNAKMVSSLGADHVIDYTRQNFIESGKRYDLIIDNVGNHSLWEYRQVLTPGGTLVMLGGGSDGLISPLVAPVTAMLLSPIVSQSFLPFMATMNKQDLLVLAQMLRTGEISSVIDKRFPLNEVAAAIRYSEEGHARGKILISVP